jgi:hypothetical protein
LVTYRYFFIKPSRVAKVMRLEFDSALEKVGSAGLAAWTAAFPNAGCYAMLRLAPAEAAGDHVRLTKRATAAVVIDPDP